MRIFICLLLLANPAFADAPQPWRVGVTADQEKQAKALLDEGNALFLEKKYPEALDKYRAAVATWDHPAIRFNIVRCLIQLDRAPEADENLKLALEYGAAPLEDDVYREALSYEKLLARQIGDLEIECSQRGVTMTLDGQPLPVCPTKQTRRVAPGRHQVVAKQTGFLTHTVEVVVAGADRQHVKVSLVPLEAAAKVVHRWPVWQPWVVFGGGLVVAGIGGLVQLQSLGNMDDFDREIRDNCRNGCPAGTVDDSKESTAIIQNRVAIGVITVGLASAVTGGVMLYMNRGRTVHAETRTRVGATPVPGGGAITLSGRF